MDIECSGRLCIELNTDNNDAMTCRALGNAQQKGAAWNTVPYLLHQTTVEAVARRERRSQSLARADAASMMHELEEEAHATTAGTTKTSYSYDNVHKPRESATTTAKPIQKWTLF